MEKILDLFGLLKILVVGVWKRQVIKFKHKKAGTKPPLGAAGLTILCPIINGSEGQQSYAMRVREYLQGMPLDENSPMAKIPNTYLCRLYVLNDVFYELAPAKEEHLKSKYLVFCTNYYGDLDTYLKEAWKNAEPEIKEIWQHCVAFDKVNNETDFVNYIKKCQVNNNLFFNGSTGDPLPEQLKSLYLKQEFSRFAYENQGKSPQDLQDAFQAFIARTKPNELEGPTWVAGAHQEMIKS